jgi:hypothetical protein
MGDGPTDQPTNRQTQSLIEVLFAPNKFFKWKKQNNDAKARLKRLTNVLLSHRTEIPLSTFGLGTNDIYTVLFEGSRGMGIFLDAAT